VTEWLSEVMAREDMGRVPKLLLRSTSTTKKDAKSCSQDYSNSSIYSFQRQREVCFWSMHTIKAIYPGTFDPLTNGHLDLIARGAKIVDQLVVAILRNSEKGTPLFTVPEREEMIFEATRNFGNVSVTTFNGLLVDFAREQGAKAVLRGIRAISDYEYEFQMAMMNRKLDPELETLFMMPAEKYTYVSSRLIKGVFQLGGDVTALVPPLVVERLKAKVPNRL
jgi:pantetheine-phosphate adenylyltransferase